MTKAFVDTNVLVRHLTRDPAPMAARATAFLRAAAPGSLLLTDLVVAETIYVLEFYQAHQAARCHGGSVAGQVPGCVVSGRRPDPQGGGGLRSAAVGLRRGLSGRVPSPRGRTHCVLRSGHRSGRHGNPRESPLQPRAGQTMRPTVECRGAGRRGPSTGPASAQVARAITLVESSRPDHRGAASELIAAITPHGARRCGWGSPGARAGKSTFIDAMGCA